MSCSLRSRSSSSVKSVFGLAMKIFVRPNVYSPGCTCTSLRMAAVSALASPEPCGHVAVHSSLYLRMEEEGGHKHLQGGA